MIWCFYCDWKWQRLRTQILTRNKRFTGFGQQCNELKMCELNVAIVQSVEQIAKTTPFIWKLGHLHVVDADVLDLVWHKQSIMIDLTLMNEFLRLSGRPKDGRLDVDEHESFTNKLIKQALTLRIGQMSPFHHHQLPSSSTIRYQNVKFVAFICTCNQRFTPGNNTINEQPTTLWIERICCDAKEKNV